MARHTLKDIARELGVSVTTVSRALNDKPDISTETKRLVWQTAREVGYVSNVLARDLRTQRTSTIGVIITDNANPFFAYVVRGIQDVAASHGYHILLCNTDEEYDKELESIKLLQEMRVAGILITPAQSQYQSICELIEVAQPFVLINRCFDNLETNYVVGDDAMGGHLATEYLISRGYRQIWCLNGPSHISPARGRQSGYERALLEHNLNYDESLVMHGALNLNDGYRMMANILSSAKPPFGVFCFSDYVAVGAMEAIRDAGLQIPEDVGVVGYDNIEFAPYLSVPLTTIDNPRYEVGQRGANLLVDILQGKVDPEGNHVILPPQLVIRSSA